MKKHVGAGNCCSILLSFCYEMIAHLTNKFVPLHLKRPSIPLMTISLINCHRLYLINIFDLVMFYETIKNVNLN